MTTTQNNKSRSPLSSSCSSNLGADWNSNVTALNKMTTWKTLDNETMANVDDNNDLSWMSDTIIKSTNNDFTTLYNYDDLSRNLDANLAEIDMENFRSEDIPSLLASLPAAVLCGGEQFASVSGSLLLKLGALESGSDADVSMSGGSASGGISDDVPLFSPVREGPLLPSFSVDSLDCGAESSYDEHELLLTCHTNKHNYTIAFEGASTVDSTSGSFMRGVDDLGDSGAAWSTSSTASTTSMNSNRNRRQHVRLRQPSSIDASMVQSDFVYTTWRKLKNGCSLRHGAGPTPNARMAAAVAAAGAAKSHSLPDLLYRSTVNKLENEMRLSRLNVSSDSNSFSGAPCVPPSDATRTSVPLYDMQASLRHNSSANSSQQSFSLVRLFFQHKGASQETSLIDQDFDKTSDPDSVEDPVTVVEASTKKNNNKIKLIDSLIDDDDEDVEMVSVEEPPNTKPAESSKSNKSTSSNTDQVPVPVLQGGWAIHLLSTSPPSHSQGTQTVKGTNLKALANRKGTSMVKENVEEATDLDDNDNNNSQKSSMVTIATMRTMGTQVPVHVIDRGCQTSFIVEDQETQRASNQKGGKPTGSEAKTGQQSRSSRRPLSVASTESSTSPINSTHGMATSAAPSTAVYVCYPNYSLPDLSFLKSSQLASSLNSARMYLVPPNDNSNSETTPASDQHHQQQREPRPRSCPDVESVKRRGLHHIHDWDSLALLLPRNVRNMLGQQNDSRPDPATDVPRFCRQRTRTAPPTSTPVPPLPKRSLSMPDNNPPQNRHPHQHPPQSPIPKGILRKTSPSREHQRYSFPDFPVPTYTIPPSKRHSLNMMMTPSSAEPQPCNSAIVLGRHCNNSNYNNNCSGAVPTTQNNGSCSSSTESSGTCSCEQQTCLCEHRSGKKSVSFSEKVSVRVREGRELSSPFNGSTASAAATAGSNELDVESPPHEFCVSPPNSGSNSISAATNLTTATAFQQFTSSSQGLSSSSDALVNMNRNRGLVASVGSAVQMLVDDFSCPENKCVDQLEVEFKVLNWLCPPILAIVNDGLVPSMYSFFGQINNSAWRVVEASAQLVGPSSRALNDLVVRLNSEEFLRDNTTKFNAFIFGLLNIHSLDSWLALVRSQESLLQKHYQPSAFMYLSNSLMQPQFNELLRSLQPLSNLPFDLDLLMEARSPPLNTSSTSTSAASAACCKSDTTTKLAKDYQNQQARQQGVGGSNSKNSLDENGCCNNMVTSQQRPRSCCVESMTSVTGSNAASASGFSLTDIASQVKRRWSGIQIGSKLLQALDKMVEFDKVEADGDLVLSPTSHPHHNHNRHHHHQSSPSLDVTDDGVATERPKPDGAPDTTATIFPVSLLPAADSPSAVTVSADFSSSNNFRRCLSVGDIDICEKNDEEGYEGENQFRLLQKKWEQLSSQTDIPKKVNNNTNSSSLTKDVSNVKLKVSTTITNDVACTAAAAAPSSTSNNNNPTTSTPRISRIPRLVSVNSGTFPRTKMDDSGCPATVTSSLRSSSSGQSMTTIAGSHQQKSAGSSGISSGASSNDDVTTKAPITTVSNNESPRKRPPATLRANSVPMASTAAHVKTRGPSMSSGAKRATVVSSAAASSSISGNKSSQLLRKGHHHHHKGGVAADPGHQ